MTPIPIPSFLPIEFKNGRWKAKHFEHRKIMDQVRDEQVSSWQEWITHHTAP